MLSARAVSGRFRTLRGWADVALIAFLFGIPWIRISGEPLVLLDVPARKFHVLGLVIAPQELYFLWLILAALALSLFFFTALVGRVWCGWACPQTVFTDVFAVVARRIQGWKGPRPPTQVAAWRLGLTHLVWLGLSLVIGFHLVAYFVSPHELMARFQQGGPYGTAFGFLGVMGAVAYLDFVVIKQDFCRSLCPYARFQGVLFDQDTLVISYDSARGEPRGKRGRVEGDCVDCGLCVEVCPTRIDIREGLQFECITCTQCIDVCDGVMARTGRAPGLIGYRSLSAAGGGGPARLLRPRVVGYGALLALVAVVFTGLVAVRVPMDFTITHNRQALFGRAADGRYGNAFTLRLENRDRIGHRYRIRVEGDDTSFSLIAGQNPIPVGANDAVEARVFVVAPAGWVPQRDREALRFVLEPVDGGDRPLVQSTHFLTPEVRDAG